LGIGNRLDYERNVNAGGLWVDLTNFLPIVRVEGDNRRDGLVPRLIVMRGGGVR